MIGPVAVPRRPPFRDRDLELATILGSCPTLLVWRERLPTVRVARATRCARGQIPSRQAWWDVRVEADDGWSAEGEIVDVEPLIEVDRIHGELPPTERSFMLGGRTRRLVRWLLWDEVWVARDRLWSRMMAAEWIELA